MYVLLFTIKFLLVSFVFHFERNIRDSFTSISSSVSSQDDHDERRVRFSR